MDLYKHVSGLCARSVQNINALHSPMRSSTHDQNLPHECKKGTLELVSYVCTTPIFTYTSKAAQYAYIIPFRMLFYLSLVSTLLYIWYILLQ